MSPLGMQQNAAKTGIGSLLISANRVLSGLTQDYFDLPAQTNPYLHTWSLSIEEQFYIFFPIFTLCLISIFRRKSYNLLLITCYSVVSLISIYLFQHKEILSVFENNLWLQGFYSPLSRAWEFLLGAIAYMTSTNGSLIKNIKVRKRTSSSLLLLLIIMIFFPENTFRYPSLAIAIPLTVIAILLSIGDVKDNGKFLDSKILKFLGDRSYSIYLWHWPFIVFSNYLFPASQVMLTFSLLISFVVSVIAYKYVENPIRRKPPKVKELTLKILPIFLILPILLSGTLGYISSEILFKRYQSGEITGKFEGDIGAINFDNFRSLHPSKCTFKNIEEMRQVRNCDVEVLLVGDSHAQHLLPGFSENYPQINFASFGMELFAIKNSSNGRMLLQEINANKKIKIVIISSFWIKNGVSKDLHDLASSLSSHGKHVIILDDVPNFPFDAFTCKYGLSQFIPKNNCAMNSNRFEKQRSIYLPNLKASVERVIRSELFLSSLEYCSLKECSMLKNGALHYLDMNHLNTLGSAYLSRAIVERSQAFCSVFKGRVERVCE